MTTACARAAESGQSSRSHNEISLVRICRGESLEPRAHTVANGGEVAGKVSLRLLNIVVKKQSALPSSCFHRSAGNAICAAARPAARRSYFSAAAPRSLAGASLEPVKRNVINVLFCGLTCARDKRENRLIES